MKVSQRSSGQWDKAASRHGNPGAVTQEEAAALPIDETASYGLVTQTTLSGKDAAQIIDILRQRIPRLREPAKADICYATAHRQDAIEAGRDTGCDAVIVIGGSNSSNSWRLVEIARDAGCPKAVLIESVADLHPLFFKGVSTVGVTSGASTPEVLVHELIEHLSDRFRVSVEEIRTTTEEMHFRLPTFPAIGTTFPRR